MITISLAVTLPMHTWTEQCRDYEAVPVPPWAECRSRSNCARTQSWIMSEPWTLNFGLGWTWKGPYTLATDIWHVRGQGNQGHRTWEPRALVAVLHFDCHDIATQTSYKPMPKPPVSKKYSAFCSHTKATVHSSECYFTSPFSSLLHSVKSQTDLSH